MKRVLKRWAAVLWALWFVVLYVGLIPLVVYAGLAWLITGTNSVGLIDRYSNYVIMDYWPAYKRWANGTMES